LRTALAFTPVNLIRMRGITVDATVLSFSVLLAVLVTVLAGLVPALELARVDLAKTMNSAGRGAAAPMRKRLRHTLVIAETSLSVVLVIGAGLLARSFVELRRVDLGFNSDNLLTLRLALPATDYDPQRRITFFRQLVQNVEALPGVRSAAAVRILPLTSTIGDWSITVEGLPAGRENNPNGDWQIVTPGYFETMGITLLRGRFLTDADHENGALVALIDENMAKRYWPGQDAVGRRFHLGNLNQPWITIVGVTKPVRHNAVVEAPRTEMFLPHAQFTAAGATVPAAMTLVVKTTSAPLSLLNAVRAQVRGLDPSLPISEVRTMAAVASAALAQPRFLAVLLAVFAGLALTLAAIGMYGVLSFTAARRTHEIGIRMALGAARGQVVRMMLSEGLAMALAGVALGLLGSVWLTRFVASQLYGVQRLDPITFALVPAVLLIVALAAVWLPARKAASTSPLVALRGG
jgi:predicted permease